jgi:hypothetical protein
VDAKALGVSNSKDNTSAPKGRRQAQGDAVDSSEQNKMVKVTETYNPTTKVAEDKTLEVVFTRTTNTQTTELQTGMDTYVATAEEITIERLTDEPGRVVIKNVPNYEFRALNGDILLQDWTSSNQETIEFLFTKLETGTFTKVATAPDLDINALIQPDSPAGQIILTNNPDYEFRLMNGETELVEWENYKTDTITFEFNAELTPTIEARGVDATIIFDAIQGLTYDVTLGGVPVLSDITDNGSLDEDSTTGKIILSGLTEGITYDIAFKGQLPDAALTDITIESRSTDASISFTAFEGFTYEVKQGELLLYTNITDNNLIDLNPKDGVIKVKGFTEGLPYDVHYSGYRLVERITQDEVDGQVDKLYVLYQYTFISFVPLTLNQRPTFSDLKLDYDALALYDKKDYFSSSTRQSFVVDNESGFIYKIENTIIENISKGILWLKDNFVPHDLRIKTNGDLEFYPLFTNTSIIAFDAFKDKYGNTFVLNNRLNYVDFAKKTTYFVHQVKVGPSMNSQLSRVLNSNNISSSAKDLTGFTRSASFWLTENNEAIKLIMEQRNYAPNVNSTIHSAKKIDENHQEAEIPLTLNSKVTDFGIYQTGLDGANKPFKIQNGKIFFENISDILPVSTNGEEFFYSESFGWFGRLAAFDLATGRDFRMGLYSWPNKFWNPRYIKNYDYIVEFFEGKIYLIKNVSSLLGNMLDLYTNSIDMSGYPLELYNQGDSIINYFNRSDYFFTPFRNAGYSVEFEVILENVGIDNGEVVKFGLEGNVIYDLIPEVVNGVYKLVPYVRGTYVAPPPTSITFQPINR